MKTITVNPWSIFCRKNLKDMPREADKWLMNLLSGR